MHYHNMQKNIDKTFALPLFEVTLKHVKENPFKANLTNSRRVVTPQRLVWLVGLFPAH